MKTPVSLLKNHESLLRTTFTRSSIALITTVSPIHPVSPPTSLPFCFIPKYNEPNLESLNKLSKLIRDARKLVVMTGAGISTESGIPDYRSEEVGLYARSSNRPIQYQEFIKSEHKRRRYWARNFVGWPKFGYHRPNESHRILADWERTGKVDWIITQNVDALHYKAGSRRVTELHGSAHRVICLSCHHVTPRDDFQKTLRTLNPDFDPTVLEFAPDGDVQLTDDQVSGFKVPLCHRCDGLLKPDIVFFGDNVPQKTKDFCCDKLEENDGFLVIGSSMFVYSGYRFALKANELGIPIGILNIGPTRADHLTDIKVSALGSQVLRQIDAEMKQSHS